MNTWANIQNKILEQKNAYVGIQNFFVHLSSSTHGTDFVITSELFQEARAISSCGTFRFLMYRLHFFITLSAPTILYIVILLQNITIILY